MPFPSGQARTRWNASLRATAVIRSIASVSASGSGEKEISAVSLRRSNVSGVEGIEGVIEGVVSNESVSTLDSGGVRMESVGGLGFGDVFRAGSGSPEHHSNRIKD